VKGDKYDMVDKPSYYLILSNPEDLVLTRLAEILCQALDIPRLDATTRVKRFWGLLHKTGKLEKAEELKRTFDEAGIDTFILPANELTALPSPRVFRKAVPESQGLTFQHAGENGLLPWHEIVLLCAGQIGETEKVTENLPRKGKAGKWLALTGVSMTTAVAVTYERSKKRQVTKERTTQSFYLDMITKDASKSVRIIGESFDYTYLANRMQQNVLFNFKNLVKDVAGFLPDVRQNRGLRSMETEPTMRNVVYESAKDFETEKLWLAQLQVKRGTGISK
jgi:hypothetical protein